MEIVLLVVEVDIVCVTNSVTIAEQGGDFKCTVNDSERICRHASKSSKFWKQDIRWHLFKTIKDVLHFFQISSCVLPVLKMGGNGFVKKNQCRNEQSSHAQCLQIVRDIQ